MPSSTHDSLNRIFTGHKPFLFGVNVAERLTASQSKMPSNLQIITLLRELFEEVSRHEVGMDVLTKLLNRRFLPTIFKRGPNQSS